MSKVNMAQKLVIAIILLFSSTNFFAQDLPPVLDPPVDFDKSEIKKIEKANELINSSIEIWKRLVNEYNPKNIKDYKTDSLYYARAYPLLVKAAKDIEQGNQMKFDVYRKNCMAFWSKHRYDSPSGLEGAKALQKEATSYFQKAMLNRQAAESYSKEYGKAFDKFHEAFSLEIIAVKKEGRALQLYRDWPVHYNYVFDDDIVKNLFTKEKPKEVAVVVKEEPKDSVVAVKVQEEPEPEPYDSTVVYYQVQIVAHTAPLNASYLKMNVYQGDMPVEVLKEEGWYKYVIGRYRTFDEANRLLKKVNIPRAFVVAYKNHKRVPIKEAAIR
ncbi:MAG TPA: SPOR domain-containing protein [Bacteroidales bacterium]|nr:SPOR domain-containing protein [Bacteroidales bacterium]